MTELPQFLLSLNDFEAHLDDQFGSAVSSNRGDRFVKFALHLCALIPEFQLFGEATLSPKKSHDNGVDIQISNGEKSAPLFIQSRLRLGRKDDFDSIISKFGANEKGYIAEQSGDLIDRANILLPHFGVMTISSTGNIISLYEKSRLSSREYYDRLIADKRLIVVDGVKIHSLLQAAYFKAFAIPNNVNLNSGAGWLNCGNVWLGFLAGDQVVNLYNRYGDALFFENIREFLGERSGQISPDRSTVNEDILDTAINNPGNFLSRNNGLTFRASEVNKEGNDLVLTEGSIVNGCQTTMCLVRADLNSASDISKCRIQTKIVVSNEAWDVARSANYQNRVDHIDLVLAKHLRPQVVRKYALPSGVQLEHLNQSPAIAIVDLFYETAVKYEEIKLLYIGIFSRSPNNIGDNLYTKIRSDLVESFAVSEDLREMLFETLFYICKATQRAIGWYEENFGSESYNAPYVRIFKERKESYRIFLALLTCSAMTKVDLSDKFDDTEKEMERLKKFIEQTSEICQARPDDFSDTYGMAINRFTTDASHTSDDDRGIRQHLTNMLKRNFSTLYGNLCRDIEFDKRRSALKL